MNDTTPQTKRRISNEVSPPATALREARAVMTRIFEIHAREILDVALKRIGVDNVWVLQGGLEGWRKKGFPVSLYPELPEVVAERLGVKLPEP